MKCHIPGLNVKIVARAVHALARVGDELYVEAQEDALELRAVSAAEAAYGRVRLRANFFSFYRPGQGLSCKVAMKSALGIFKSPGQLDKQVELLELRLDPAGSQLVFHLRCRHGVLKTHYLSILDCENLEAAYSTDMVPNRLSAHHKVFSEAINNFQINEDQVTFEVNPQVFCLRNYTDANDRSRVIRTQLFLKPAELDVYSIGVDTNITFSLKEFRAVLNFAEALNLPISLHFETTGKPAVFIVDNNSTFDANFVMATERIDYVTQQTSLTVPHKQKRSNTKRSSNVLENTNNSKAKKPHLDVKDVEKILDEDSHLFNFIDLPDDPVMVEVKTARLNRDSHVHKPNPTDIAYEEEIPSSPVVSTQVTRLQTVFRRCFEATFDPSRGLGPHAVLAEDSDGDE